MTKRGPGQTHCKRGHPLSGDNLYTSPKTGYRSCITCRRDRLRRYRKQQSPNFGGLREATILRDDEKCVRCGMTRVEHRAEYGCDITVDHIDGNGAYKPKNQKNNSLDNLQTLCLSCHGKKDIGKAGHAKLNESMVANIKHLRDSLSRGEIASIYSCHPRTVGDIFTGKTWREVK